MITMLSATHIIKKCELFTYTVPVICSNNMHCTVHEMPVSSYVDSYVDLGNPFLQYQVNVENLDEYAQEKMWTVCHMKYIVLDPIMLSELLLEK